MAIFSQSSQSNFRDIKLNNITITGASYTSGLIARLFKGNTINGVAGNTINVSSTSGERYYTGGIIAYYGDVDNDKITNISLQHINVSGKKICGWFCWLCQC